MKMSVDNAGAVLAAYITDHIGTKAGGGLMQFASFFAADWLSRNGQAFVERQVVPMAQWLGMIDDARMLDIDAIADTARAAMTKMGGKVYYRGIIFDTTDIDHMLEIARRFPAM